MEEATGASADLLRRRFEEVWNRGRADAIEELLAPDATLHGLTPGELTAAIQDMHAALLHRFPDPVDVLEDRLAHKLGLRRGPGLSLADWRRTRVRYI